MRSNKKPGLIQKYNEWSRMMLLSDIFMIYFLFPDISLKYKLFYHTLPTACQMNLYKKVKLSACFEPLWLFGSHSFVTISWNINNSHLVNSTTVRPPLLNSIFMKVWNSRAVSILSDYSQVRYFQNISIKLFCFCFLARGTVVLEFLCKFEVMDQFRS